MPLATINPCYFVTIDTLGTVYRRLQSRTISSLTDGSRTSVDVLVKENDVGLPDFASDDADDCDVAELTRLPAQLVVMPELQTYAHTNIQHCTLC